MEAAVSTWDKGRRGRRSPRLATAAAADASSSPSNPGSASPTVVSGGQNGVFGLADLTTDTDLDKDMGRDVWNDIDVDVGHFEGLSDTADRRGSIAREGLGGEARYASASASTSTSTSTSASASRRASLRRRGHSHHADHTHSALPVPPVPALPPHPLSASNIKTPLIDTAFIDTLGDPSRPALQRATSMVERQVAESSRSASEGGSSLRGSFDMLRMSPSDAVASASGEVEVLIHQVKPTESLAGIALLYGIDLPTLRRVNKLWASDPIHIRTHLYVPLEACKWNKASENLVRGPGEGQVTLAPKALSAKAKSKGKERERNYQAESHYHLNGNASAYASASASATTLGTLGDEGSFALTPKQQEAIDSPSLRPAETFMPSTNIAYHTHTQPHPASHDSPPDLDLTNGTGPIHSPKDEDEADDDRTPRVLDVVRIPSSQLRFFPRARPSKPPDMRRSLDIERRYRSSLEEEARTSSDRLKMSSSPAPVPAPVDHVGGGAAGPGPGPGARRTGTGTGPREAYAFRRSISDTFPIDDDSRGPFIVHDLTTLPGPLRSPSSSSSIPGTIGGSTRAKKSSNIVRLRPPQSSLASAPSNRTSTTNALNAPAGAGAGAGAYGLANRLSSFFTVPPPPPLGLGSSSSTQEASRQSGGRATASARISLDSTFSNTPSRSSRNGNGSEPASPATAPAPASKPNKEESIGMEMVSRSGGMALGGRAGAPDLGRIKARISSRKKED